MHPRARHPSSSLSDLIPPQAAHRMISNPRRTLFDTPGTDLCRHLSPRAPSTDANTTHISDIHTYTAETYDPWHPSRYNTTDITHMPRRTRRIYRPPPWLLGRYLCPSRRAHPAFAQSNRDLHLNARRDNDPSSHARTTPPHALDPPRRRSHARLLQSKSHTSRSGDLHLAPLCPLDARSQAGARAGARAGAYACVCYGLPHARALDRACFTDARQGESPEPEEGIACLRASA